ncbi:uncharacterized protein DSM5745_07172 [Aspergillus mulundensis]|uniref:Leucine-rich repeat domain-containing protein n=1 Tax=Aspergillus mulundensis TaxID=1810919 RepID=A0A3D8RKL6_9EURO|nr:Uncharacterized protein DSM5745_07172 [Aspergillus mulundensis]RDW74510.1 Uncharacterized protein DSM5745_07172 [Aspergillus mulundensis]
MEGLNDDIILLIVDHLEDHGDRYNAIIVNHRFHELFSRALYRSASLKNVSDVQSFLKTITLQPSLASAVRSLDFEGWTFNDAQTLFSQDDIALFSNCAKANCHSPEEHAQWESDLSDGVDEAWIALLLSFTPNIRQLKLVYPSHSLEIRGYLDRLFQRVTTQQKPFDRRPAFTRLHDVSLRQVTRDDKAIGTFSPSQIEPFLRMPSLTRLAVDSLIEYRPDPSEEQTEVDAGQKVENLNVQTHSLSEITLTSSNAFNGLNTTLSSCPGLKSFKYQHTDALLLAEGFRPSAFNTSLARHKATLETIWLDNLGTHLPFTISGLNESHEEWFGSFAEFTALKDLRIRLTNLLYIQYSFEPVTPLTDVLPEGIERLYIEDCKERSLGMLLAQVGLVLEARKTNGRFRRLRSLDIEGFFHDEEEDADTSGDGDGEGGGLAPAIKPRICEMVEPVRDVCERAGIRLSLRDRMCLHTMG